MCRALVVRRGIQGSPLGEPGRAAAAGRPWLGALLLAPSIRLWVVLRWGVGGCGGGYRRSCRFLVLLYSGIFVTEGFEWLAGSRAYLI